MVYVNYCEESDLMNPRCQKLSELDTKTAEMDKEWYALFTKGCDFTDNSVMTIAVGEALLAVGSQATVKEIEEAVVTNMQDWGKRYPFR